jgi:ribosomal protein S18 acetylase RimI-like enzyme
MGTYVAKVEGKVLGFTDPYVADLGRRMIGTMYVAPEAQGLGVGGKLMRHVLKVLGRDEDIFLEVVAYNDKAIGFYKHFGFEKTDAVVPEEEGRPSYMKSIPQIEMVLRAESD